MQIIYLHWSNTNLTEHLHVTTSIISEGTVMHVSATTHIETLTFSSVFQIRCVRANNPSCSGNPRTVVITDMNYYPVARYHFDLSGTAFGAMAMPGRNDQLRHAGIIDMQFRRVPCNHAGMKITFFILPGANPNYFPVVAAYANRDGTVVKMDVMRSRNGRSTGRWEPMYRSWGIVFRLDTSEALKGPLSLRITSDSGTTRVAYNIIPANWRGGSSFWSNIQY